MHFLETAGFDRHRIDAGVEKVDLVADRQCRMLTAPKCAGDDA